MGAGGRRELVVVIRWGLGDRVEVMGFSEDEVGFCGVYGDVLTWS